MASMEDILTGSADKPVEPKEEPKEEKQEQEAAVETSEAKPEEKPQEGDSVSTEEKAPKGKEETAPPAVEKHNIPIAALLDEREKRQTLQRELEELRKTQAPKEEADFFEDPEGALKARDQAFEEKILQNKLEMSQAMAKESHPDFDELLGKFNKAMEADETLKGRAKVIWNDALSQPHPALSVYNAVKRELAVQELSDPDAYRKKIEAEIRAEIAKEEKAFGDKTEKAATSDIPESLADERSVGERSGPKWAGPKPLNEIIPST